MPKVITITISQEMEGLDSEALAADLATVLFQHGNSFQIEVDGVRVKELV